jgi:PIN domain nuclease of toxin-antitoxin system
MICLLDTHTFIWLDSTPALVSSTVLSLSKDPDNRLVLSLASVWEMQIKLNLGKLSLPRPLPETIEWHQQHNDLRILPVTLTHIFALDALPHHHRDPFDRLLIAQAQAEQMTILSRDSAFAAYAVNVIW